MKQSKEDHYYGWVKLRGSFNVGVSVVEQKDGPKDGPEWMADEDDIYLV